MSKILIIDDERPIRRTLKEILEFEKYKVDEAENGKEGLEVLKKENFDVVLLDIKMPQMDGMEVLSTIVEEGIDTPVVMISGHGNIETAVDALKKGAFDFIEKPLDLKRVLDTLKSALNRSELVESTRKIVKTKKTKSKGKFDIIGNSEAIENAKTMISKVAPTDARVLITGPNGAGKELVARQIHLNSDRAKAPFIEVNCAAIPSELIESELFGHEKGSFTGAHAQKIGKFEQAQGGTIFLDELGDMSLPAQAKVLRALQERKITRVGGNKDISVNVRVLAATNKNLMKEIEKNTFREDLYHRVGVILIHVPPLVERLEDIPLLVEHFLADLSKEHQKTISITPDAINELKKLPWTGNVRELRNVLERLIVLSDEEITEVQVKLYAPQKF